jgi:hypothetical protein
VQLVGFVVVGEGEASAEILPEERLLGGLNVL